MSAKKTTAKDRKDPEMGKRLRQARESLKLRQEDVAKCLGLTTTAYQNYEYGREISSGRILQICAVLECSPNWLLGYSDEGEHLAENSLMLHQLREAFVALNDVGQQKVTEYAQDLTHNPSCTEPGKKDASAGAGV